ncbi:MAG: flagellar basal-body rod protein FlgB [Chromatiales bacterium 21-64-14]|nr:MAG: flagellar basal-body rod protein FlgB [Chromatiales bacterium 21-64-14]HQU15108.1 flagellar basal body rod protein FlgB [Gammaproteobacteria bacterium]
MAFSLDQVFGIHAQALLLRGKRAEILASNLANADTPNYKARDIDFKALLEQAQGMSGSAGSQPPMALTVTHADQIQPSATGFGGVSLLYRVPTQPSLDGNTVNTQQEEAEFSRNAVQYQASLTFLTGGIKTIMTAIMGT